MSSLPIQWATNNPFSAHEFTDEFHTELLLGGVSRETARTYSKSIGTLETALARKDQSLLTINQLALRAFMAAERQRLSIQTLRNRLYALRRFYAFSKERGLREDDPSASIRFKRPRPLPEKPFSRVELTALLRACTLERDRVLILALAATGVRISELLGMRAEDIDYARGTVLIRGKGSKERQVAPGNLVLDSIRGLGHSAGPIWRNEGGHVNQRDKVLTANGAKNNLYRIARRAGVSHCHPHRFRVTMANFFLEQGGDIGALQVLMGHAHIGDTAHYAGYSAASRALQVQSNLKFASSIAADAGYSSSAPAPSMDPASVLVDEFITRSCITASTQRVRAAHLWHAFDVWAGVHRHQHGLTQRGFSKIVARRFEHHQAKPKDSRKSFWHFLGLGLRPEIAALAWQKSN